MAARLASSPIAQSIRGRGRAAVLIRWSVNKLLNDGEKGKLVSVRTVF
jgi:hypothetical protein